MGKFKEGVVEEYPLPFNVSIWSQSDITDFDKFISQCREDLASDIFLIETIRASGMTTILPEGTINVLSAQIAQEYIGNKYIKPSYTPFNRRLMLRAWPAFVTYNRRLVEDEDLDKLTGDDVIMSRCYVLWKMAVKEATLMQSISLDADNGQLNLEKLSAFASEKENAYYKYKEEIMIYGNSRGGG